MSKSYFKKIFGPYSNDYSRTESKIAKHLIKINHEVANKTIRELSEEIGVSKTAIFDFVKKHGFDGFQSFKIEIAQNQGISNKSGDGLVAFPDILSGDNPYLIAQKVVKFSESSIKELIYSITEKKLINILDLINSSNNLHFFGHGLSSVIALDSYHKFTRTKYTAHYVADFHMQLSHIAKLTDQDCVFLFSHSGESVEIIRLAKILHSKNIKTIVLTGNPISELTNYADISLVINSHEAFLESESLLSRTLYITMMDIIYISVLYSDENENKKTIGFIRDALSKSKPE